MQRRDFIGLLGCGLLGCGGRDDVAHSLRTDHVQLSPGMRQDLTPENAPAGTLALAQNVRYVKSGGISLRPGFDYVASTTQGNTHEIQGSGGLSFISAVGETPALGTAAGKVFAQDTGSGLFNFCGNFSTVVPVRRRRGLITERAGSVSSDKYGIASNSDGYVLIAACDVSGQLSVALEAPDGTRIVDDYSLGPATKCSAISVNGVFVVVSQNGTTLTARAFVLTAGALTYNQVSAGALFNSSKYWDICEGPSGTWFIVYQDTATNITIAQLNSVPAALATGFVSITVAGNVPVSVFWDDTNARLWIGWWNDPGVTGEVRLRAFTSAGTALCAITTLATSTFARPPLLGMPGALGSAFFTYNRLNTRTVFGYVTLPANAANQCTSVSYSAWWVCAISKPDARQRSWCKTVRSTPPGYTSGDTIVERSLLLKWEADASFGSSAVELSGPLYENADFLTVPIDQFASASNKGSSIIFATTRVVRNTAVGQVLRVIDVYQYQDVTMHATRSCVALGSSLAISGQPSTVFGRGRGVGSLSGPIVQARQGGVEIGFPLSPQITLLTQTTVGGLVVGGTYSYVAVFEWISTSGERHRSAPSDPVSVTMTAGNFGVDVTISAPNWGQRWDPSVSSYPVVHVYRTENGGTVHYRATPGSGAPVANDVTDGLVVFSDPLTDAQLLSQGDALYTDAALCDYDLAPSARFMWRDERRVWFGGLWEPEQVACSLDIIPAQPIEYSDFEGLNGPVFRVLIGEPVTGGAYQDGVNYVFAEKAIYVFSGEGPDRQGNGDFSRPRIITSETGCIDYRSVIATSRGIFFQSTRGIELLPRGGGTPQFVGAGIQDLLAEYPTVLGAAIHLSVSSRSVRFVLSSAVDLESTIVAVYDLDIGAWSYDTTTQAISCIGSWPSGTAMGLRSQSDTNCALSDSKTASSHEDGGGFAPTLQLRTNVVRPWGLAGYGRLNSVTALFSSATATISLTMGAVLDDPATPGGSSLSKGWAFTGAGPRSDYRELTVTRECTGFALTITLANTGSPTLYPAIHGLTIEAQQLEGARRLPASEQ